jgi:uncharacterized cofD-like protein
MDSNKKLNVVVIGGGTGTFTVLSGLKHYRNCELTAVVTMTDNGGSAGKLRDEFGYLPVGDIRQCLVALSREDDASMILRQLFQYRFPDSKSELSGHSFGNLFLTVLTEILGSEVKAIEAAVDILNVEGKILPITTDNVDLMAEYEDGSVLMGEKNIDEPNEKHNGAAKVKRLWTQPPAIIHPPTKQAIASADFIVMGPGDLYSSLLANIVVGDVAHTIKDSPAKIVFVGNLVSKYGQTHGLKQSDYLAEMAKYIGRRADFALINDAPLPEKILEKYRDEQSYPVEDDLGSQPAEAAASLTKVVRQALLSEEVVNRKSGDTVRRSLLRHDSQKLAQALMGIFAGSSPQTIK